MSVENEQDESMGLEASDPTNGSGSDGKQGRPDSSQAETGESADSREAAKESDVLEAYQKRVKELEEENSSLKDQYLRKQADFENFRKRMYKEKEESAKFANSQLLQDLVSIIDDFERAIKSSEESKNFDTLHEGISLIEKQFVSMLERKWGLVRFESVGEPFDPQKHEAINAENRADHDVSMVLEDYQKGYILNDRVLRPAKVKVSLPLMQPDEGKEAGNGD